jgi:sulfate transport system substrate-binding protein
MKTKSSLLLTSLLTVLAAVSSAAEPVKLLNVSYDPTRELYSEINPAFAASWKAQKNQVVTVDNSHGGSGKQARAVIDGVEADVVTLGLAYDIDSIAFWGKLLPENWQSRLPNNSTPYYSTIVFLVRKGNPQGIKDWNDLVKPGVGVITPNPKTSGGARWNYLAAWGYALKHNNGDAAKAEAFVRSLYKNVPVLDTGARGSTNTFVKNGIGDVLLAWENEAFLALKEFGADKFEIVIPSVSIKADPPVALVEKNAARHGTTEVATAYLDYLYTEEAQKIIAKNYYRPTSPTVAAATAAGFPKLELFTLEQYFGNWTKAHGTHFADGGVFDKLSAK